MGLREDFVLVSYIRDHVKSFPFFSLVDHMATIKEDIWVASSSFFALIVTVNQD